MRYVTRWAAFVLLLGFALPLLAADDKKADDKKPGADKKADDKKPADKKPDDKKAMPNEKRVVDLKKELEKNVNTDKSIRAGQISGKVVAVVESKKSLRLSVPIAVPHINQGALNAAAQNQVEYAQALARGDANGAAQALVRMQQNQAQAITLQTVYKEIELTTTDDVKVRLANPPPKYDEKGRLVRPSGKELQELRGPDPKLPGYNGEFSDLAQEQVVTVTLVRKKNEGPRLPLPKAKGKQDPTALLEDLPQVSMIVIMHDPNAK
jgi:hypothetical protein